ncbi:restless-like transposase [Apiospora kogelbergensis]|uniref:restless-like transposase n=1 Tax=Apiospora kogelbergensis TaxID=1337665 RepID=UPI003130EC56
MLINTLKMPIYRAAADSIPITNQGHEAALFRHFPGFAFSERCIIANNPLPKNIHPSGLQNAAGHLYTKHFVLAPPDKPKLREEKKEAGRQGHYRASRVMSLTPEVPVKQAVTNKLVKMFDRKRFQQLLVAWIVAQNQPFSIVEQPELRAIFEYLNPQVSIQEAHLTRPSIKSLIVTQYSKRRSRVINAFKDAPGLIHLVFDGWRSGNRKNPRKVTLAISEMPGRHQGEDVARVVSDLVTKFDIGEKIGACVTDNASSNDTAMDHLGETFDWGGWTGRRRRGRCFGHILNLAARPLLHGNAEQPVETFIETHEQLTDAEYDLWRRGGPVVCKCWPGKAVNKPT